MRGNPRPTPHPPSAGALGPSSPAVCKGRGDGGRVFGDMVDRLALAQLVPVVHRRDPRARGATATSLAQRRAGGPCGPTGASVAASRSRRRLAQIEGADLTSAEQDIEAAILVGWMQRNAVMGEGAAELERAVAEAQPAVLVDAPHDRPGASQTARSSRETDARSARSAL